MHISKWSDKTNNFQIKLSFNYSAWKWDVCFTNSTLSGDIDVSQTTQINSIYFVSNPCLPLHTFQPDRLLTRSGTEMAIPVCGWITLLFRCAFNDAKRYLKTSLFFELLYRLRAMKPVQDFMEWNCNYNAIHSVQWNDFIIPGAPLISHLYLRVGHIQFITSPPSLM